MSTSHGLEQYSVYYTGWVDSRCSINGRQNKISQKSWRFKYGSKSESTLPLTSLSFFCFYWCDSFGFSPNLWSLLHLPVPSCVLLTCSSWSMLRTPCPPSLHLCREGISRAWSTAIRPLTVMGTEGQEPHIVS